jgi:hypothetical protein
MTTCAAASVAWPQRSISTAGVNQRSSQRSPPGERRTRKAVSDRLFSAAMAWSTASGSQPSRGQTAAGLPANWRRVKASTW